MQAWQALEVLVGSWSEAVCMYVCPFTIEIYRFTHSLVPLWHTIMMPDQGQLRTRRVEDDGRMSPDV